MRRDGHGTNTVRQEGWLGHGLPLHCQRLIRVVEEGADAAGQPLGTGHISRGQKKRHWGLLRLPFGGCLTQSTGCVMKGKP